MPKNIIICADGTGNTTVKGRGTNVFKLYEAVDQNSHRFDGTATQQVAIYHDGVGTESLKWVRIFGGIFGWGLSRNVKQLYGELARVYDPDDRIYHVRLQPRRLHRADVGRAGDKLRHSRPDALSDESRIPARHTPGLQALPKKISDGTVTHDAWQSGDRR